MISKLEEVDLRNVWPTKQAFTGWLFEIIEVLGEQLSVKLSTIEKDEAAGPFYLDIMAKDKDGRPVFIENQLERIDNGHCIPLTRISPESYFRRHASQFRLESEINLRVGLSDSI
jgi:hypothetical protein